jgi:caffeoyl-CoA O-methyltransferase
MSKPVTFADKLLPNQREYSRDFAGDDLARTMFAAICRSSGISENFGEFDLETSAQFTQEEMGSNPVSLRFFEFLIRATGVKRVLEIGSFIGVSAIAFARALPADGRVTTIEKFSQFATIARRNFARNGCADKIDLMEGDALKVLERLPTTSKFDLIFIDGNKERYLDYFLMTEKFLDPRGFIVVDDCFFHGDALNATPTSAKGAGCKALLDHVARRSDYVRIALPLSNGIFMMCRG